MRYLPQWMALEKKENVCAQRCDSCAYGSPHLKSLRFLATHMDISRLARRCSRDHNHITVEGKYAKSSASYTDELAHEIALCFKDAIFRRKSWMLQYDAMQVKGLENQLVNLVALTREWHEERSWAFRLSRRINLHEMSSLLRLAQKKREPQLLSEL